MNNGTPRGIPAAWSGRCVLVVGDVMLDEYLWGEVRRISPEAPVPVVEISRRTYAAGGAANTAANVAALAGRVALVGLVGDDPAGSHLRQALRARGIDDSGLVTEPARPTTTKTRVVAHQQHVVRLDQELRAALPRQAEEALLDRASQLLDGVDACVLSDYSKGVVSPEFARRFIAAARRAGKPVVVDPKGTDYRKYRGATVVKPNVQEASQVLNRGLSDTPGVLRAGRQLLGLLGCDAVLITRGPDGMTLVRSGAAPVHIPSEARDVFDVTGAGDTVAGMLALALAAGVPLEEAARLANCAAGVAVGKVGTAPVTLDELLHALAQTEREGASPGTVPWGRPGLELRGPDALPRGAGTSL